MAVIYLRSTDGDNADSGLTWALAKATLAAALTAAGAGGTVYVSQAHAETQATNMTLTSPGTAASPVNVICVNDAAEPPTALATTATVTTTATTYIGYSGVAYVYGITFQVGSGASSSAGFYGGGTGTTNWTLESCEVSLVNTNNDNDILIGPFGSSSGNIHALTFINTNLRCGGVGHSILVVRARFVWRGGAVVGATMPTALFQVNGLASAFDILVDGVDLSGMGSGKSLVSVTGPSTGVARFRRCKLGASVTLTSGTNPGQAGPIVMMDNCDSADTQYRMQRHAYEGDVYSETTVVRTGGASDGTTPLAHKMVSSANPEFYMPLYGPDMAIWNATTGSAKTVTVEIIHDSLTALTDAEVWLEVEYLGTAGFPLALFATDRAASILATPANQTSSSATWTTTGLTNPNKQKLEVTFTPQEIGIITCRVVVAKVSYTVYVDPLITVA